MRRWIGALGVLFVAALVAGLLSHALISSSSLLGAVALPSGQAAVVIDDRTARAFVATGLDGAVRVLDLDRGTLLRTVAIQPAQQGFGYARTFLAVDARRGRVVAATLGGAVFVLDAGTGAVLRAFAASQSSSLGGMAVDPPTGQIFLGDTQTGAIVAIDPLTGAVRRRMLIGGGAYRLSLYPWNDRLLVLRTGMVGSALLLLDTRSGRLLATMPLGGSRGFFGGTNVAINARTGRAYVTDVRAGTIRAPDLRLGQVLFTASLGIRPRTIAVDPSTGHLFVLDMGADQVRMLDGATGVPLRTVAVGAGSSALVADGRAGRVLVASWGVARARQFAASNAPIPRAGQVRILDARTGATVRTIAVGPAPAVIAIDEASGHAVVIASGATTAATDPLGWMPASLRKHLPWLPSHADATSTAPARAEVLAGAS